MGKQDISRAEIQEAVRRARDGRDRDIGYLLGDPLRELPITIEEWVTQAHGARNAKYDAPSTGRFSLMDMCFESACALVHDARPREARDLFQMIVVPEHRASPTKVLA